MPERFREDSVDDAIVIGGSFAGLAAALQLARARRNVLVIDGGSPRNRFAAASHGFLGQDGRPPFAILAEARAQLAAYPIVRLFEGWAADATHDGAFAIQTDEGFRHARRLILAFGVRDRLPEIPGLEALWGTGAFHCPYCHGYEVRDRPLAVLGDGPRGFHQAAMLPDWSDDVVLFTHGPSSLDDGARAKLARRGVTIEETPVLRFIGEGAELRAVEIADGRRVPRAAVLTSSTVEPASTLAERLGCELEEGPLGTMVRTDARKETSVPGVYAAGDLARMPHSVSFAVGDGALAGAMAHQSLLAEDWF